MRGMKLIMLFLGLMCAIPSFSQDVFDRSLKDLEKVNSILLDAVASFLKSPNDHSNTMVVFDKLKKLNVAFEGVQSDKYETLAKWDNYKVRLFYDKVDKMQAVTEAFEELLRTIAGYVSGGIEGPVMEVLLEPLFDEAGWEKKVLDVTCPDAYFVEYSCGEFKMMFIKSTRPADDVRNNIFHNIEVTFTFEGLYGTAGSCYVGGGRYRMIQFKDDENVSYRKVVKAESVRK